MQGAPAGGREELGRQEGATGRGSEAVTAGAHAWRLGDIGGLRTWGNLCRGMWHDMSRTTADALNDGQDTVGGGTCSLPALSQISFPDPGSLPT